MATSFKIDLTKTSLAGRDLEIAQACIGRDGGLRSSKPTDGEAAYVWRMAAFQISTNSKHWCMPITADFGLPAQYWGPDREQRKVMIHEEVSDAIRVAADRRHARCKELQKIADAICDTVPKDKWHGVMRWAKAFGAI